MRARGRATIRAAIVERCPGPNRPVLFQSGWFSAPVPDRDACYGSGWSPKRGAIHNAAGIDVDEVFQVAVSHVLDRLLRAIAHAIPVPAPIGGDRPGALQRDRAST